MRKSGSRPKSLYICYNICYNMDGVCEMERKIVVWGNLLSVSGETYSVKEILKKYKLKWDKQEREWYNNTEYYTADEIIKLAEEIDAKIIIEPLPPESILRFVPEQAIRTIEDLKEYAQRKSTNNIINIIIV